MAVIIIAGIIYWLLNLLPKGIIKKCQEIRRLDPEVA
jgi:hypothetical protein